MHNRPSASPSASRTSSLVVGTPSNSCFQKEVSFLTDSLASIRARLHERLNTGEVKVRKKCHVVNGILNDTFFMGAIVLLLVFEVVDFANAV